MNVPKYWRVPWFIYDQNMIRINQEFTLFVEELEKRVLSYKDFMAYADAYYEDWMKRIRQIFE